MKLLILGASSYIGARLFNDLSNKFDLVGTYFNNQTDPRLIRLDLNNKADIEAIITLHNPDIIIHLANYSSSRNIAGNEANYQALNLEVTKTLVNLANKYQKKIIFVSSMASVTKSNLYGQLKAESEQLVKGVNKGYFILRLSAVIGVSPNQKNNKITDKIIATINGNRQSFDTSWLLQPTYIGHITQVIEKIINDNVWNTELSLYINHPATQYQIASDTLSNFGMDADQIDLGINIPLMSDNAEEVKKYGVSPMVYSEIIQLIVKEIKVLVQNN